MSTYKILFKTCDAIALAYERQFMDLNMYDDSYELFLSSLDKPNARILELGCGPGVISRFMMQRFPVFELIDAISLIYRKNEGVEEEHRVVIARKI